MPEIKVQHVVSCSSEDKNHPSENLLKPEGTHKWKCSTAGEKSATVVLQFEKASQIHSLDIGNEGSAFIEVLVGRASAVTDQDYQVLLVASSFMTPTESRNGTNRNSVRMFGSDRLSKTTANEKWDRVKIVCTQPFNKKKKIGAFFINPENEDDISSGSVFANRGKLVKAENPPVTGAAAVRAASRLAEESRSSSYPTSRLSSSSSPSTSKPDENKTKTDSTAKPSPSSKRKHALSDDEEPSSSKDSLTPKPSLRKQSTSLSSTASSVRDEPPLKKTKSEPPKESPAKSFRKLMEGVTFVLSGFQNPFRGELRDKAIEMGAMYMPDWKKSCTHLVCAFANTPKYNQNGFYIAINRRSCYHGKNMDASSSGKMDKKKVTPSKPKVNPAKAKMNKDSNNSKGDNEDDIYGISTDEDEPKTKISQSGKNGEDDDGADSGLPDLPDFFSDKHFFLYGTFSASERRLLRRYIAAYDGELENYMGSKALSENENLVFVKPKWIYACHDKNKLLPYQPYAVVAD
ncbi:hypothetical protein KUTeg_010253 [Tegillarca granosa]|uniref:BRCT domain-containing protein n=1 Tax=Tegillarca granosa TaxID=220873 RepID=A0ABQ9F9C0_TEGGR|nr:hypothetical protein KUTeg_010253 [Tegillarca granosa]